MTVSQLSQSQLTTDLRGLLARLKTTPLTPPGRWSSFFHQISATSTLILITCVRSVHVHLLPKVALQDTLKDYRS